MNKTTRERFDRTTCDCSLCKIPCRCMPGCLIPEDIPLIMNHLGYVNPGEGPVLFAYHHLLASPGATVSMNGNITRVPTLVPSRKDDGTCHWLDDQGHCAIHSVAPFGCAYHDMHMNEQDGNDRSAAAVSDQAGATADNSLYLDLIDMLQHNNRVAPEPREGRQAIAKEMYMQATAPRRTT